MKTQSFLLIIAGIVCMPLLFSCSSSKKTRLEVPVLIQPVVDTSVVRPPVVVAVADPDRDIRIKYAGYLNMPPDSIRNIRLYKFIDEWLATRYVWGGDSRAGIDCSAFIKRLLNEVYGIQIPRTSIQQFYTNNVERFGSRHYLSEGDLVFFRTMKNKNIVTHVGLYLTNDMFVNVSVGRGVSIASLNYNYWKRTYVAAGRVILKKTEKLSMKANAKSDLTIN